VNVDHVKIKQV